MSVQQSTPIYIFIGPPGAGKGSLARLCKQRNGWSTLSTGDLCRSHIALQTEIGKQIDFCIKSGKLISDEVIVHMVQQWLSEHIAETPGLILDGFPRTYAQAQLFQDVLYNISQPCCVRVVELQLRDEVVIHRLTNRRICGNSQCQAVYTYADARLSPQREEVCDICQSHLIQRDDDAADVVTQRLQTYHDTAGSLLTFYRNRPEFLGTLDADTSLDTIYQSFIALTQ